MSEIVSVEKTDRSGSGARSTTYGSTVLQQSGQNVTHETEFLSSRHRMLPILMGIFMVVSMVVPYVIAVSLGHVKPIFPYISDAGAKPPESCIFSQLLNLSAFFAFASVYVRYKQVNDYYQDVPGSVLKWNKAAVVFGCLASLGLSIAANFQETDKEEENKKIGVHVIGGCLCFGVGSLYGLTQSWISYQLSPQHCSLRTCRLRLFFSIFTTIFIITNLLFEELSQRKWLPDWSFVFHIISTTSEWANAIAFVLFFLTFVGEFDTIETGVKQCQSLQNVRQEQSFCSPRKWISFGLSWLPLLFAFFLGISIIIPYYIAVTLGHVKPIFPSISEDGATPPESCLFSQFLNLAAFFGFATILTRYKQVNDYYHDVPGNVLKWSKAALFFGSLADIGMSMVANFQVTNIYVVHITGASMSFILGLTYEFIQTWISFKLTPQHSSLQTSRLRLSLSIITTIFIVSFGLFNLLAQLERFPENLRVIFTDVSAMSEWASAFSGMFFFLTFVHEFQEIEIEVKRCQGIQQTTYESLA